MMINYHIIMLLLLSSSNPSWASFSRANKSSELTRRSKVLKKESRDDDSFSFCSSKMKPNEERATGNHRYCTVRRNMYDQICTPKHVPDDCMF